ncbi:MAG TPA: acetyl-CoA acetyltransferase [Acidimicrobiia bacterium]|nr:acetyl-CoA acetyltransferase [Acidimicrobiia bacterium]
MTDPRTPVVVGVGQVEQRVAPADAREPIALFADAVRAAADDSGQGGSVLARVDTVAAVQIVSWPYADPGARVAAELGIEPRRAVVSTVGGNSPQLLVNEMAAEIAAGSCDVVVIGGAESMHARWGARREPRVHLDWAVDEGTPYARVIGDPRAGTNEIEQAHFAVAPTHIYPLFETALRAAADRTIAEHQQATGELWSQFAAVAASNPHAWSRVAYTAEAIVTPTAENRMVVFPYTKRMCANIDVDQGAAVILCSYEAARSMGIAEDRMVFLHAGADAHDHWFVTERAALAEAPAIGITVRAALDAAGLGVDDVARFDLYSCFPSAVQMAMHAIGLRGRAGGDDRPLTVTGGLGFAGGPVNNYPTHGIAAMVDALRADPGSVGLTTALGWYATKHSAGVWSTSPPARFARVDPARTQAEADALPRREPAGLVEGDMTIEATSVVMERDGTPAVAIVAGLLPDSRRALANSRDPDLMLELTRTGWEGRTVRVVNDGTANTLA